VDAPSVAVAIAITGGWDGSTAVGFTGKSALVLPSPTKTDRGISRGPLKLRETVIPPIGDGPLNETVATPSEISGLGKLSAVKVIKLPGSSHVSFREMAFTSFPGVIDRPPNNTTLSRLES
jgi:hypothetical protein